jgi:hypothetical protein
VSGSCRGKQQQQQSIHNGCEVVFVLQADGMTAAQYLFTPHT